MERVEVIWTEFKRVEECCDVTMSSYMDGARTLRWIVIARPRGGRGDGDGAAGPLQADEADLTEAVARIVTLAKERKLI